MLAKAHNSTLDSPKRREDSYAPFANGQTSHRWNLGLLRWSLTVGNDTEILGSSTLETRCETLTRVSRAIRTHRDPKDLFETLVGELRRALSFDYLGVSLREKTCLAFQKARGGPAPANTN